MAETFTLSPTVVEGWERKQKEALAKAEAYTKEAAQWGQKVQAARLILSSMDIEVPGVGPEEPVREDNMTAAIEEIANDTKVPLTHKEMKARLRELGFTEERLANYYYTPINRLKEKGKITVGEDKRIGPGFL